MATLLLGCSLPLTGALTVHLLVVSLLAAKPSHGGGCNCAALSDVVKSSGILNTADNLAPKGYIPGWC